MQSKLFPIKTTKQKKTHHQLNQKPNIQLKTDIRAHIQELYQRIYIAYDNNKWDTIYNK